MKLYIHEELPVDDTIVTIECRHIDRTVKNISNYVRQYMFTVEGKTDGKICQIPVDQIEYIETVDKRTFLYCESAVYQTGKNLAALELELRETPIVRISKNCLLNVTYLKSVEPYVNHRMKAQTANGEYLIISRKYIENLKKELKRK